MKIRLIHIESASAIYSQAIYHSLAEQMCEEDDPILVILQPNETYVCIGLHQDLKEEVNLKYCEQHNLPVIRRHIGGGTVLLDEQQLFFQYIFPKNKVPNQAKALYALLLQPVLHTYHQFGIPAALKSLNDIQVSNKKIGGTGAGTINNATVLVGSFLYDFNCNLMANCVKSPSNNFVAAFESLLEENITTINQQSISPPSVDDLINTFREKVSELLELKIENSNLNEKEEQAIQQAADELQTEDWLQADGKKLVKNGLKIAAGVYLLENSVDYHQQALNIRIQFENGHIQTIWLESADSKTHASLLFVTSEINTLRPVVEYQAIHEVINNVSSRMESLSPEDAEYLAKSIFELASVNEY